MVSAPVSSAITNEEYSKLRREVERHPGYVYLESRRVHDKSLKIFGGNFRDLAGLLNFIENPQTYLRPEVDEKKRNELFAELQRFLHNYVASAESLVSHTRSYIKHRHHSDQVGKAYREKVEVVFKDHPPTVMIKDLRNYVMHHGLPVSSIRESFNVDTREPPKIQVLLKVGKLLAWKKWSSASKKYLKSLGTELRLSVLLAEYHNNVVAFYRWLDEFLEVQHKAEVEEMRALAEQVTLIEKGKR